MSTLTGNSNTREWQVQATLMGRIEQRYQRQIAREIARFYKAAAREIKNGQSFEHLASEHKNKVNSLLTKLYRETVETFVEYFSNTQKARNWVQVRKQEIPKPELVDRIITEWIQSFGGPLIQNISDQTLQDVREVVTEGLREGKSETQIAKDLSDIAPTISAARGGTIARTEISRASNRTSLEMAKTIEAEALKVWVASKGNRTRETHLEADKRYRDGIPLDQKFLVGRGELDHPSDPNGPLEETINCRCVMVYKFS